MDEDSKSPLPPLSPDSPLSSLRTTQRAPRSCKSCAQRKVKCDKAVPCSTCIRRGEGETCARETVIVRGQVTTGRDPGSQLSYEELIQENARLKQALSRTEGGRASPNCQRLTKTLFQPIYEEHDYYENLLFEASASHHSVGAMSMQQILLPSRECSNGLIAHDREWNSWVHYALEYPAFELEHSQFMDRIDAGASFEDIDSSWLAVYFSVITAALLTMDLDEVDALGLPSADHRLLQRNWYGAALLFLHRAEFMRNFKLGTVQAIAILGMSFVNFGDHDLYVTMWSCAVRVGHTIGLDREFPANENPLLGLSRESRRRLWWTLVICEWLAGPIPAPQLKEFDFDVPLPTVDFAGSINGREGLQIHPVQYHIFMARTAVVYNRFRIDLRRAQLPLGEIVRLADEELAEVINTLPQHLQPDMTGGELTESLETSHPWIRWQRVDVTLVLLHHRLRINRILQQEWHKDRGRYNWARAVCIQTAKDIIWISQNWEQPTAKKSTWALAIHLYSAAIFLFKEAEHGGLDVEMDWRSELAKCITYMDEVKSRNAVADQGSAILRGLLAG
ncbi:hypothetical protein F4778DRAFT_769930 [Xylariomycetidae sp. FL2044]|nr:hypothetical protein F4778DRAFT_769930 [Xylariomycetidae sp. FL2044]